MPPKFRSCECQRIYPNGHVNWFRSDKPPGSFYWSEETRNGETFLTLWIHLPYDPPEHSHAWSCLRVYRKGELKAEEAVNLPAWLWDGNEDRPTLASSIKTYRESKDAAWHGWLRAGKLVAHNPSEEKG